MTLKTFKGIALDAAWQPAAWPRRRPRWRRPRSSFPAARLPHRRLRAERTPWANGKQDYLKMINAREGGINGVKLDLGGMRVRLRHRPRRRVLRAAEDSPGVALFEPQSPASPSR